MLMEFSFSDRGSKEIGAKLCLQWGSEGPYEGRGEFDAASHNGMQGAGSCGIFGSERGSWVGWRCFCSPVPPAMPWHSPCGIRAAGW
ncbi:hypothetical protein SKB0092_30830 [Roseomonas mucosa]